MVLRTRNERVLYAALSKVCHKVNPETANLMVNAAIVQADNETPKLNLERYIGYSYHVARTQKGLPMPEDL